MILHSWLYSPWNVLRSPFLRSFSGRLPPVYPAFSVRFPCVHCTQICVHCSLVFTVSKSFTFRSPCIHLPLRNRLTFIQRLVFIIIKNTEDGRYIYRSWNEKKYEEVGVFFLKRGFLHRIKTTKNSENFVKLEPEVMQFMSTQSNKTRSKYITIHIWNAIFWQKTV